MSLRGHLDMLLLAVISQGPTHGYMIMSKLRMRSGGRFDLAEGALYPLLHKLESDGLIRGRWEVSQGRRRKVYELSRRGRSELDTQLREWRQFTEGVDAVLGYDTP